MGELSKFCDSKLLTSWSTIKSCSGSAPGDKRVHTPTGASFDLVEELVAIDNDNMEVVWKYEELGMVPTTDKYKVVAKGDNTLELTISTYFDFPPDDKMQEQISKGPAPSTTVEALKKGWLEGLPAKYQRLEEPFKKAMTGM